MELIEIELINDKALRLEEVRKAKGWSKSRLADELGSEQSHISKVLSGKVNLGKHLNEQIIRSLDLSPLWWETGEGEMFKANISQSGTGNVSAVGSSYTHSHVSTNDPEKARLETENQMLREQLKSEKEEKARLLAMIDRLLGNRN